MLDFFRGNKQEIYQSHVKNLLTVAAADGSIEEEEWGILVEIGKILGMSETEIQGVKDHPERVTFLPPRDYDERLQQIKDLVMMMTIDGDVDEKELNLCKKFAIRFDVLPQIVDQMVSDSIKKYS